MKTLMGILITAMLLTGAAWAGEGNSIGTDFRMAVAAPGSRTAAWGDDPGEIAAVGHRDRYLGRDRELNRELNRERLWDYRIETLDRRLQRQRDRIQEGRQSGELTPNEAHRLWNEYKRIEHYSHLALKDKWLSNREWHELTAMLDQASHKIFRQKSNDRRRVRLQSYDW